MPSPFEALLAAAYHRDQIDRDRAAAVALLRQGLADAGLLAEGKTACEGYQAIKRARGRNAGEHGCHVTAVVCELLTAALDPGA